MASITAYPSAVTEVSGGYGWGNSPSAIKSSDNSRLGSPIIEYDSLQISMVELKCLGFDFSALPSGATINGIVVSFEGYSYSEANSWRPGGTTRLVKDGTNTVGSSKKSGFFAVNTDNTVNVGSSSDLWGTTFTAEEVKSSNFGVRFISSREAYRGPSSIYIDSVSITVYYTDTGTQVTPDSVLAEVQSVQVPQTATNVQPGVVNEVQSFLVPKASTQVQVPVLSETTTLFQPKVLDFVIPKLSMVETLLTPRIVTNTSVDIPVLSIIERLKNPAGGLPAFGQLYSTTPGDTGWKSGTVNGEVTANGLTNNGLFVGVDPRFTNYGYRVMNPFGLLDVDPECLVLGITVTVQRFNVYPSSYGSQYNMIDGDVILQKNYVDVGTNKATSNLWPRSTGTHPTTDIVEPSGSQVTYGNDFDTWGLPDGTTVGDINGPDFGVRISGEWVQSATNATLVSTASKIDLVTFTLNYQNMAKLNTTLSEVQVLFVPKTNTNFYVDQVLEQETVLVPMTFTNVRPDDLQEYQVLFEPQTFTNVQPDALVESQELLVPKANSTFNVGTNEYVESLFIPSLNVTVDIDESEIQGNFKSLSQDVTVDHQNLEADAEFIQNSVDVGVSVNELQVSSSLGVFQLEEGITFGTLDSGVSLESFLLDLDVFVNNFDASIEFLHVGTPSIEDMGVLSNGMNFNTLFNDLTLDFDVFTTDLNFENHFVDLDIGLDGFESQIVLQEHLQDVTVDVLALQTEMEYSAHSIDIDVSHEPLVTSLDYKVHYIDVTVDHTSWQTYVELQDLSLGLTIDTSVLEVGVSFESNLTDITLDFTDLAVEVLNEDFTVYAVQRFWFITQIEQKIIEPVLNTLRFQEERQYLGQLEVRGFERVHWNVSETTSLQWDQTQITVVPWQPMEITVIPW